eukprot:1829640-Rhodomonas_salina.1
MIASSVCEMASDRGSKCNGLGSVTGLLVLNLKMVILMMLHRQLAVEVCSLSLAHLSESESGTMIRPTPCESRLSSGPAPPGSDST